MFDRVPGVHAGGKWRLRYESAGGQGASLELDVNYMLRAPLWNPAHAVARPLGTLPTPAFPIRGIHELAAGKLAALLARRASRNLFDAMPHMGRRGLGVVARHLRPGHLCYVSYESALAEFGSISQVPMVYIVATTGNSGEHRSPYGDLEFCHTSRSETEILANTVFDDRLGLRLATPAMAHADLARVRPGNLHLVDDDIHAEVLADWGQSPAAPHA